MEKTTQDVLPMQEAENLLRGQGFKRPFTFSRGMVKIGNRSVSPRKVAVLQSMQVQSEGDDNPRTLYALRTRLGKKGYLLDETGEFEACLQEHCW